MEHNTRFFSGLNVFLFAVIVVYAGLVLFGMLPNTEWVNVPIHATIETAGKGIGSFNSFRKNMIDLKVARCMLPYAFAGVTLGYGAGFIISKSFERVLLYLFVGVAIYLLIQMILSLNRENPDNTVVTGIALKKSGLAVLVSSFSPSAAVCSWEGRQGRG